MESLGFQLRSEAVLQTITGDVVKSSEIEGEHLDPDQVRSSVARRLGLEIADLIPADRNVDGVVEMMLDATQRYQEPLTEERLFGWHAAMFPTGRSGMNKINVGKWRDDSAGTMQVVSGATGKEKVHFQAPRADTLDDEMDAFLTWFEKNERIDPVLKAGVAHLWFVTIHPFDDGNGRIARAITDLALARSENSNQRFYSMSSEIRRERAAYYRMLEKTQKGGADITPWLEWFLDCLGEAFNGAETTLGSVLTKARFWEKHNREDFNERQRKVVDKLQSGTFHGKLTSSLYGKLANCSQDTAGRDINELMRMHILKKDAGGGRSTSYSLEEA